MTAFKYCFFAAIATSINLASQFTVFNFYSGPAALYLGIGCGTISGLICKYILDKKYVFKYTSESHSEELRNVSLYSVFGVFTTLIFWASEILFDTLYQHHSARYIGAIIGLSIGYTIKYYLDKKFVFSGRNEMSNVGDE